MGEGVLFEYIMIYYKKEFIGLESSYQTMPSSLNDCKKAHK